MRFWPCGKGYVRTSPAWRSPAYAPTVWRASYVSGYLATDPPPGKERMVGIDATHAWASVWTPQNQWLGLDPTNDQMVDERYIIVGWGRDYADVPPLRESSTRIRRAASSTSPWMSRLSREECCMRDFTCPNCGQRLAFENSVCLSCGHALGFSLEDMALLVIASGEDSEHGGAVDSSQYQLCANLHLAECNWLVRRARSRGCARRVR